jgi:hypothetical protein
MASFVVNAARGFRQDHLFRARSIHNGRPAGWPAGRHSSHGPSAFFSESVAGPVTVIGQTGGSDGWTRSG